MVRASAIALAIMVCTSGAQSASDMIGVGRAPCSVFNQSRDKPDEMVLMGWITGWLTGFNAARRDEGLSTMDFDKMDYEAMRDFMRSYCESHPKDAVARAGIMLMGTLSGVSAAPVPR
jgi:hypothetical protein